MTKQLTLQYEISDKITHKRAMVYYDKEQHQSKYIVIHYQDGRHLEDEDYHTDDLQDAFNAVQLFMIPRDENGDVTEV